FIQAIAVQLVGAMGFVQLTEEQRLAVVGPGHAAVAVVKGQLANCTAGEILDEQPIDLVAAGIQAVTQQVVIGADGERAKGQKTTCSQCIGIEQQLFVLNIKRQRIVGGA